MLRPGDMFVQDYYAELQKGMICVGIHEETEDKICHFYSGLRTKIQDIVDYKEYDIVNRLFTPRSASTAHPELLRLLELIPRWQLRLHVLLPHRQQLLQ
jgi:hypothetical protein